MPEDKRTDVYCYSSADCTIQACCYTGLMYLLSLPLHGIISQSRHVIQNHSRTSPFCFFASSSTFSIVSLLVLQSGRGTRKPVPSVAYRISPSLAMGLSLAGSTTPRSFSISFRTWMNFTCPRTMVLKCISDSGSVMSMILYSLRVYGEQWYQQY